MDKAKYNKPLCAVMNGRLTGQKPLRLTQLIHFWGSAVGEIKTWHGKERNRKRGEQGGEREIANQTEGGVVDAFSSSIGWNPCVALGGAVAQGAILEETESSSGFPRNCWLRW